MWHTKHQDAPNKRIVSRMRVVVHHVKDLIVANDMVGRAEHLVSSALVDDLEARAVHNLKHGLTSPM